MRTLVLVFLVVSIAYSQVTDDSIEAFKAILAAENAGADVSGLVSRFNEALGLAQEGNSESLLEAQEIFDEIMAQAADLQGEAARQGNLNAAIAVVKVVVLIVVAGVVWVKGDEWFWRLWLRTKKGYVLE